MLRSRFPWFEIMSSGCLIQQCATGFSFWMQIERLGLFFFNIESRKFLDFFFFRLFFLRLVKQSVPFDMRKCHDAVKAIKGRFLWKVFNIEFVVWNDYQGNDNQLLQLIVTILTWLLWKGAVYINARYGITFTSISPKTLVTFLNWFIWKTIKECWFLLQVFDSQFTLMNTKMQTDRNVVAVSSKN